MLVLNFWASWCGHCVRELPALIDLNKKFREKNIPARVIFINVDADDAGQKFIKKNGFVMPFFRDPSLTAMRAFGSSWLPTTVFIDSNGKMIKTIYGELTWSNQETMQFIKQNLPQDIDDPL